MTPGQFLLKFYHTPVGRMRDADLARGVVAESDPAEEVRETKAKARALLDAIVAAEQARA